jgi:hypothetical protein
MSACLPVINDFINLGSLLIIDDVIHIDNLITLMTVRQTVRRRLVIVSFSNSLGKLHTFRQFFASQIKFFCQLIIIVMWSCHDVHVKIAKRKSGFYFTIFNALENTYPIIISSTITNSNTAVKKPRVTFQHGGSSGIFLMCIHA